MCVCVCVCMLLLLLLLLLCAANCVANHAVHRMSNSVELLAAVRQVRISKKDSEIHDEKDEEKAAEFHTNPPARQELTLFLGSAASSTTDGPDSSSSSDTTQASSGGVCVCVCARARAAVGLVHTPAPQ